MIKKDFTAQSLLLRVQVSEDFWRRGEMLIFMVFKAQTELKCGVGVFLLSIWV